jgi:hypothetical protein
LVIDLTVKQYSHINLAYHCDNIDTLLWFDNNFKMNYDFTIVDYSVAKAYDFYKSPLKRIAIQGGSAEIFEYVCNKNPNAINNNTNDDTPVKNEQGLLVSAPAACSLSLSEKNEQLQDTILDRILTQSSYELLPIAYKYGITENHSEWQGFIKEISRRCSLEYKKKFVWGILNKKISDFPLEYIKILGLTMSDFLNIESCTPINNSCSNKYDCDTQFYEKKEDGPDCPKMRVIKHQKDKPINNKIYTKAYCQNMYNEIKTKYML